LTFTKSQCFAFGVSHWVLPICNIQYQRFNVHLFLTVMLHSLAGTTKASFLCMGVYLYMFHIVLLHFALHN